MERELGKTERKTLCTSVLDTKGSQGSVGLVLGVEGRWWRSKAQLIHADVELLQIRLKHATTCNYTTSDSTGIAQMCGCHQAANTGKKKLKSADC